MTLAGKKSNALANYKQSVATTAMTSAEREGVAKRNTEDAFDEVFTLRKSIWELEGIFNFKINILFRF